MNESVSLYKIAWFLILVISITISCNLTSALKKDITIAQETADAAITKLKEVATHVEESGFVETAKAVATEAGEGAKLTIEALATEVGKSEIMKTAQAYLTQEGGTIEATLEAAATEISEYDLIETAQSVVTEGAFIGEAPSDIPIVAMDTINQFYGSEYIISYTTTIDHLSVLDFYLREMPANGWEPLQKETFLSQNVVVLYFEKMNRKADVSLTKSPFDNSTVVLIVISSK